MNFLSIFVLIPLLMLLGLWLSRNIAQIRAVMVAGASALLVAAVGLTVLYLQARHRMNTFSFKSAVKRLMAAGEYDFIFIDTPGGIGEPLQFAASVADTAYIIVEPTRAAIRAADRTAEFLYLKGVRRRRLIINKLAGGSVKKAKDEVISIIDSTSVKLIGVVPYDPELIRAGNRGILVDEILSFNVTHAFDNIAARTLGEGRRLFAHIHRLKKLK